MPTPATEVEIDAQYRQLREECGLLDRGDRGKLLVSGPDAAEFLQGQLTNDVEALKPGEGCYAALLDRKGHVEADMRVLRLGDDSGFWIDTEPVATAVTRRHLQTYKIGREVEVTDVGEAKAILSLIGPATQVVAGTPVLGEHENKATSVRGIDCVAVGVLGGVDLLVDAGESERLRASLVEAGAVPVGAEAAEILRVERGAPRYGAEISIETMPAETGIVEAAVSFTKGCYIGQEPVARLHHRGRPNRHLRGLRLSAPASAGEVLRKGEKEVGTIGSAVVSPVLGSIALAVVRREVEPGESLSVGEDGVTAELVDLPFG